MLEVSLVRALEEVPDLAVRRDEPVSRHAEWRVGGPAELWLVPETEEALEAATALLSEARLRFLLLEGNRLLVRDGGVEGALLRPGRFAEGVVDRVVGAWTPAAVLGRHAITHGWRGLHRLALRSGTVAEAFREGALAHVTRVRVLRGRRVTELAPDEVKDQHGLLSFTLDPPLALPTAAMASAQQSIARRVKNGRGMPGRLMADSGRTRAAELIREANLEGVRLRSARIGQAEPNSLINLGCASTRDVLLLTRMVQDRVKAQTGARLKPHLTPMGRNSR